MFARRSPGRAVERAIRDQFQHGEPRVGGIPVYGSVDEAKSDRPSRNGWLDYARRGVMPTTSVQRKGFFVIAGEEDAELLGCQRGDFVVFVPPESVLKPAMIDVGCRLYCILRSRRLQRFAELEVTAAVKPKRGAERAKQPQRGEYDLEFSWKRMTYFLRFVSPVGRSRTGEKVMAVALKVERDVLVRNGTL